MLNRVKKRPEGDSLLFRMLRKGAVSDAKAEKRSSQSYYDIEYAIADLIDKTPLEMLSINEARFILFQDPKSGTAAALHVCLSSTRKFSPGKELAEVFINTLEGYEKLIDLRQQKIPCATYADFLAMEAARILFRQAGLFQDTLREHSQRPRMSNGS
jgi:hypothetical protein